MRGFLIFILNNHEFQIIYKIQFYNLKSFQYLELVNALIDAAFDKKGDVRRDMKCSLQNLGIKQPELVLTSCNVYLSKHQKVG